MLNAHLPACLPVDEDGEGDRGLLGGSDASEDEEDDLEERQQPSTHERRLQRVRLS